MIRLDFARTVPRPLQVMRWGVLVAGIAATAATLIWSDTLQGRLDALDWQRDARAAMPRPNGAARNDGATAGLSPQLRAVLHDLGVDWRSVFGTIENAVTRELRIMSIRPDPQRQLLLIQAKATSGAQAQHFVERLQASGVITDAHLVHEARDDDDELIDFSVRAHWKAAP